MYQDVAAFPKIKAKMDRSFHTGNCKIIQLEPSFEIMCIFSQVNHQLLQVSFAMPYLWLKF